jgi:hypothetical protein
MDDKRARLLAQQVYQGELDHFNYETEQRTIKARRLLPQIFILPLLIIGMLVVSYPAWRLFAAIPWMIGGIGIFMEVFVVVAYLAYRRSRKPPQPPPE